MNGGVLAHETFHRHFNETLTKSSLKAHKSVATLSKFNEWQSSRLQRFDFAQPAVEVEPKLTTKELKQANFLFMRGIDEGLADYFGYQYTHNPNWMAASLNDAEFRDLSHKKIFKFTTAEQKKLILKNYIYRKTGDDAFEEHVVGAYFANFLYEVAQAWGPEKTNALVLRFIPRFLDSLVESYSTSFFSMGRIVKILFEGEQPPAEVCEQVYTMFSGELSQKNFQPCTPVSVGGETAGE
jgi:hypothetical protein